MADEKVARLLRFASQLVMDGVISQNAKGFLKSLILRKNPKALALLAKLDQHEASNGAADGAVGGKDSKTLLDAVHTLVALAADKYHALLFRDYCDDERAKDLSLGERNSKGWGSDAAYTYSEVDLRPLAVLLRKLAPSTGTTFYDLGSGVGKVVFAMRLLGDFDRCVGIEKLDCLHEEAELARLRFEDSSQPFQRSLVYGGDGVSFVQVSTKSLYYVLHKFQDAYVQRKPATSFHATSHALQGDFLEENWSDGDVVFINSSCFDYKIMERIAQQVRVSVFWNQLPSFLEGIPRMVAKALLWQNSKDVFQSLLLLHSPQARNLKAGAIVVSMSRALEDQKGKGDDDDDCSSTSPDNELKHFDVLERSKVRMSWGVATLYVQRRRGDDGSSDVSKPMRYVQDEQTLATIKSESLNSEGALGGFMQTSDLKSEETEAPDSSEFYAVVLAEARGAQARAEKSPEGLLYKQLFEGYSDDSGRQASEADKRHLEGQDSTLTYGEVMYAPFKVAILDRIAAHGGLGPHAKVFMDVGCGTAKPCFVAALTHPFEVCRGVECLPELHRLANELAEKYVRHVQPQLPEGDLRRFTTFDIAKADAFDPAYDWSNTDVCFANSTCFNVEMFEGFRNKCRLLKPGSWVACTTSRLGDEEHFDLMETGTLKEDWGCASLFLHRRRGELRSVEAARVEKEAAAAAEAAAEAAEVAKAAAETAAEVATAEAAAEVAATEAAAEVVAAEAAAAAQEAAAEMTAEVSLELGVAEVAIEDVGGDEDGADGEAGRAVEILDNAPDVDGISSVESTNEGVAAEAVVASEESERAETEGATGRVTPGSIETAAGTISANNESAHPAATPSSVVNEEGEDNAVAEAAMYASALKAAEEAAQLAAASATCGANPNPPPSSTAPKPPPPPPAPSVEPPNPNPNPNPVTTAAPARGWFGFLGGGAPAQAVESPPVAPKAVDQPAAATPTAGLELEPTTPTGDQLGESAVVVDDEDSEMEDL